MPPPGLLHYYPMNQGYTPGFTTAVSSSDNTDAYILGPFIDDDVQYVNHAGYICVGIGRVTTARALRLIQELPEEVKYVAIYKGVTAEILQHLPDHIDSIIVQDELCDPELFNNLSMDIRIIIFEKNCCPEMIAAMPSYFSTLHLQSRMDERIAQAIQENIDTVCLYGRHYHPGLWIGLPPSVRNLHMNVLPHPDMMRDIMGIFSQKQFWPNVICNGTLIIMGSDRTPDYRATNVVARITQDLHSSWQQQNQQRQFTHAQPVISVSNQHRLRRG